MRPDGCCRVHGQRARIGGCPLEGGGGQVGQARTALVARGKVKQEDRGEDRPEQLGVHEVRVYRADELPAATSTVKDFGDDGPLAGDEDREEVFPQLRRVGQVGEQARDRGARGRQPEVGHDRSAKHGQIAAERTSVRSLQGAWDE